MTVESKPSQQATISDHAQFIARVVILAVALVLLTRNVTKMFIGWHEANSAIYSYFARNHIEYGLGYTKLFNTWGDTLTPPAEPRRYLHHPPLLTLLAAIPMFFFGDHEWVGRSAPIAMTLAGAWLLMVIVSRCQSPLLGLLSGFFYVTLPITAYFGRTLEIYTSPVQFFSLLMLHGYLQWAGLYGNGYRRAHGAVYYTLGVVLGIGTGWAVIIMAGLIWLWHICRTFGDSSLRRLLLWLTVIPVASITAVIIHMAWGYNWNISWLVPLFLTRALAQQDTIFWTDWFFKNWGYLTCDITVFGIGAGVIYLAAIPLILRYASPDSPLRQIVRSKMAVMPILLTAVQGFIWVFAFKRQSWLHDYWLYLLAPFFAVAMASVVLVVFVLLARCGLRLARSAAFVLVLLPMLFFMDSLDELHQRGIPESLGDVLVFLKELPKLVPHRAPVMISEPCPQTSETFGNYTNYWIPPHIVYYANRPLIYSTDINEIQANSQGCSAYVMLLTNDPKLLELAQQLNARYKLALAHREFMVFLLDQPPNGK